MMEKPKPKEEQTAPAVKKKSAEEAVQELEKRLAALGGPSPPVQVIPATNGATSDFLDFAKPPAPEAATTTPAPAAVAPAAQVRGGKNALLVSDTVENNRSRHLIFSWDGVLYLTRSSLERSGSYHGRARKSKDCSSRPSSAAPG